MVLVGANLKKIREGKKINLSEVSKNLNISIQFLESIENDERDWPEIIQVEICSTIQQTHTPHWKPSHCTRPKLIGC